MVYTDDGFEIIHKKEGAMRNLRGWRLCSLLMAKLSVTAVR